MGKFHPQQPAYLADPYPYLSRLRSTDPVHYSPEMQGYVLTRYRDCAQVLRDDEHFSSDPVTDSGGLGEAVRQSRKRTALGGAAVLANSDGVLHERLRAALAPSFRARVLAEQQADVADFVRAKMDEAEPPIEVMERLAGPVALYTVLNLLGIPEMEQAEFRRCVVTIMRGRMDGDRDRRAAEESHPAVISLRQLLQRCPAGEGALGSLRAAVTNGVLAEDEMLMLVVHVATAGNAATAFAIGNTLLVLARHPAVWADLRAQPSLLTAVVEECLRLESPTHITSRFSLQDAVIGGRRLPPGRTVHLVIPAANRDSEAFPDPDCFDARRNGERQLSFGLGVHFCLGATLGRVTVEAAVSAILTRFGQLSLAPGGYEPMSTIFLRGPRRLALLASGN